MSLGSQLIKYGFSPQDVYPMLYKSALIGTNMNKVISYFSSLKPEMKMDISALRFDKEKPEKVITSQLYQCLFVVISISADLFEKSDPSEPPDEETITIRISSLNYVKLKCLMGYSFTEGASAVIQKKISEE